MNRLISFIVCYLLLQSVAAQQFDCKNIKDISAMERARAERTFLAAKQTAASPNFTIHYYRCWWKVDPAIRFIEGKVSAYFITTATTNNIVFDLINQLTVSSVLFRGQPVAFNQTSNQGLQIQFPLTINAGEKDSVVISYSGVPGNSGFGSFIQDSHAGTPVMWTLSEAYGARDWWPCRNGLDDKADSIDITIVHPSIYKSSSNGVLQSKTTASGFTSTSFKHRYPIATYLVALAVTNYAQFDDVVQLGSVSLPVNSFVYPEDSAYFRNNTAPVLTALQLFHNTFAPYPFINEKYGHTQFGWGGGMEHQTNSFIVSPDKTLMAHELAHQWFGDKITCGSWADIWLNEGFATFCANYFLEQTDELSYRTTIRGQLDYITSQVDGSVFVRDTSDLGNIFNSRLSYDKGSFLLRMLRWTLGDEVFFNSLKKYQDDVLLKYGFARTADLQRNLQQVSGKNLQYFFDQWFYGQGYPSFVVKWNQNTNNFANIKVNQTTSHQSVSFFKVPLALTFKNATQEKAIVVSCDYNGQLSTADIGFKADTVLVDTDLRIISKNNFTVHETSFTAIDGVSIYPNPVVNNQLYVSVKNPSTTKVQIQLINVAGQKLWGNETITAGNDLLINIPVVNLVAGMYLVKVMIGNEATVVKKILKY